MTFCLRRDQKPYKENRLYNLTKFILASACGCLLATSAVAAEPLADRPVVYLTFDDGPSADDVTERLLDLLAGYGAKATFFVTGRRARKAPEKISAILYAGHALGNHTHSHAVLTGESESGIESEFRRAGQAVADAGGPPLTCFRAPFGAVDSVVKRVGSSMGMTSVNWSVDTRDWDSRVHGYRILESLNRIKDGSVVLMHDGPLNREKTAAALADWLATHAHLYQFKALPQCIPYGTSEVFAAVDDQEIDVQLEEEDIPSLLNKLRSYRFTFQADSPEQARATSTYREHLASRNH